MKTPQNMVADTLCWNSPASWFCLKQPELLESKEPLKRCYSKMAPGEQLLHLCYICKMYNNILSLAAEGVDEVKSKAVNEMMERIKHGVVLRPVKSQESKVRTTTATIMSCFLNSHILKSAWARKMKPLGHKTSLILTLHSTIVQRSKVRASWQQRSWNIPVTSRRSKTQKTLMQLKQCPCFITSLLFSCFHSSSSCWKDQ